MSIRVALNHRTSYRYDQEVSLYPQIIRLRPAAHSRTPTLSYSLKIQPEQHFENWQQDPHGNFLCRLVFPEKVREFSFEVDLVAELTVVNPFDFFLEGSAEEFPFVYEPWLARELIPYLECEPVGPKFAAFLQTINRTKRRTIDFLVELNQLVNKAVGYTIRMEPGFQTAEETLERGTGSCRDSAWMLVQAFRNCGLAARFVSGYSIQLTADIKAIDGPSGVAQDVVDLHAWCEVYLPGAGWVGLDATSGLMTGEGHIPLACTPDPYSAAPVTGDVERLADHFEFSMKITRIHEDPRVTKPYTDEQWQKIDTLGKAVDQRLEASDVRLTMGGEPTFVSIDDMESPEWNTEAVGPTKRVHAGKLLRRLRDRFAPGGLLHIGQGKWYPGEQLPRWALSCHWRLDGQPIWKNQNLFAEDGRSYGHTAADAQRFTVELARRLEVEEKYASPGYEDLWYYIWRERKLPINVDPFKLPLADKEERTRLARVFEQGLGSVIGYVLPVKREWFQGQPKWSSGPWPVRPEAMFLIPGDSPMGLRLPLVSLPWMAPLPYPEAAEVDPFAELEALEEAMRKLAEPDVSRWRHEQPRQEFSRQPQMRREPAAVGAAESGGHWYLGGSHPSAWAEGAERSFDPTRPGYSNGNGRHGPRDGALRYREDFGDPNGDGDAEARRRDGIPDSDWKSRGHDHDPMYPDEHDRNREPAEERSTQWADLVRTALCVEPRNGVLHVFLPPTTYAEDFLDVIEKIEATAEALRTPVTIEGYLPPRDRRLQQLSVTPDPGVIEVNVHPVKTWDELVENTTSLYDDARQIRLGTEKFNLDGRYTGTGGGNHVVLGGERPADSPFLRRPHVLKSLIGYWNNHPSLSYLFSGMFIGPTSQAPRVDEGRRDAIYELQLAFEQIPESGDVPSWLVDRVLRNLLVDITGNTHRSEFCIDKLYSPDSASGRLGLVEFRGFEMPPHARMSLTQQLLVRSLVARFWDEPYREKLVSWGTTLHDRFMLPHFLREDFTDVCEEMGRAGMPIEPGWFDPHFEFRCQKIGEFAQHGLSVELRQAIEPWYVLGEEPAGGATSRFVDSSVERLQVLVRGMNDSRHFVLCNGRRVPLHPTGVEGEYVAGVRYRAWQPPRCLHPTIGIDTPLTFDVLDGWMQRSLGGATYHVAHPGGLAYSTFPVNAYEAESRRINRFFRIGHTGGKFPLPPEERTTAYPLTLDLRWKGRGARF